MPNSADTCAVVPRSVIWSRAADTESTLRPVVESQVFTRSACDCGTPNRLLNSSGERNRPNCGLAGSCSASSSACSPAGSGRATLITSVIGVPAPADPRSVTCVSPGSRFWVTVNGPAAE